MGVFCLSQDEYFIVDFVCNCWGTLIIKGRLTFSQFYYRFKGLYRRRSLLSSAPRATAAPGLHWPYLGASLASYLPLLSSCSLNIFNTGFSPSWNHRCIVYVMVSWKIDSMQTRIERYDPGWPTCANLPRTLPVWALKVPCSLSSVQLGDSWLSETRHTLRKDGGKIRSQVLIPRVWISLAVISVENELQLTLEQQGFKLCRSTIRRHLSINTCSTTGPGLVESADAEPWMPRNRGSRGGTVSYRDVFDCEGGLNP